ncbi:DUF4142 domain-containing protein [Pedobacter sp. PLR]|uniref:DUF4142 domain-containing protein n=1 Tax=Pedobacter sp. PLR TaxID=2994465 RepID=UPI0022481B24|nr:DUF4142 domain-containing protein [Pedobacter sp. PLR]MCX2450159.1 DUF4142 domain-containing protein [Pedobacter sp. PLR]
MNTLRIITTSILLSCLIYSCSTSRNSSAEGKRKRSKITTINPGIKNPGRSVINASGDGLTPGISEPRGAGSMINATNIASNAIGRANTLAKGKQQNLETLTDAELLNRMATAQLMEISVSNRAGRTATKDNIKNYAGMISSNHTEILKELKKLTSQKNIVLEKEVLLRGTPKTDLDFVKMMVESNRNIINIYTIGSNSTDPELKAFTLKQLPILKKHLAVAQELSREIK